MISPDNLYLVSGGGINLLWDFTQRILMNSYIGILLRYTAFALLKTQEI